MNDFLRKFFVGFVFGFVLSQAGLAFSAPVVFTPPVEHPFFRVGDGHLQVRSPSGAKIAVQYLNADGTLDESAFRKIDALFGFPTATMGENISRRLIGLLDYFSDSHGKNLPIQLISGYRSQNYNNKLRAMGRTAARTSTHIDGMAADFSLPGVDAKKFWDDVRAENCCGVGYYHGKYVHVDSGRPRFWMTETSKVKTDASAFNRYLFLSSEYDRYNAGATIRVFLTSVSDFGFGLPKKIQLVAVGKDSDKNSAERLGSSSCEIIADRHAARFIAIQLPDDLKAGRYKLHVDFCKKTAPEMPDSTESPEIEIVK